MRIPRPPERKWRRKGATIRRVILCRLRPCLSPALARRAKLDELAAELAPHVAAKLPGAETLAILVDIAGGRGAQQAPRVAQLADEYLAFRKANDANRRKGADLSLFEIARRGMDVPELVGASERLCRALVDAAVDSSSSYHVTAHLRRELAEFELRRAGASLRSGAAPPLKFWRVGAEDLSSDDAAGAPPPWWVFHDGHLRHVGGPSRDYLVFRYPLSGSFEFSVDSDMGHWGEGNIGYAGLVAELINGGMQPRFFPFGATNDVAYKADVPDRNHQYNRIAVRVSSDKVAYVTNGRVVWEDPSPSRNSPFLMLETWGDVGGDVPSRAHHRGSRDSTLGRARQWRYAGRLGHIFPRRNATGGSAEASRGGSGFA